MEYKLSTLNNYMLIACYSLFLFFGAGVRMLTDQKNAPYLVPTGESLWWVILIGFLFLAGDIFYFLAYNKGGTADVGVSVYAIAPVIVFLIKAIKTREFPDLTQFLGYVLLFIAVGLIMKKAK